MQTLSHAQVQVVGAVSLCVREDETADFQALLAGVAANAALVPLLHKGHLNQSVKLTLQEHHHIGNYCR